MKKITNVQTLEERVKFIALLKVTKSLNMERHKGEMSQVDIDIADLYEFIGDTEFAMLQVSDEVNPTSCMD